MPAGLPHLVVGVDNTLQAYDPHTMLFKWLVAFDTPPVSAYRPDGRGGNALDPEQVGRASLHSGSSGGGLVPSCAAAGRAPFFAGGRAGLPRRKVKGQLAGGTSVLVGALRGSLYALPADHLMLSATAAAAAAGEDGSGAGDGAATAAVVWPKRAGRMPLDITPTVVDMCAAAPAASKQQLPPGGSSSGSGSGSSPNGSDDGDGSSGSALALLDDSREPGSGVVALNPVENGAVLEELSKLTCPQPPLGIHSITVQQGQTVGWLPLGGPTEEVRLGMCGIVVLCAKDLDVALWNTKKASLRIVRDKCQLLAWPCGGGAQGNQDTRHATLCMSWTYSPF
jgi:hypothetical protein